MASIIIRSMKADNTLHRHFEGKLEVLNDVGCAIWSPPGMTIRGPNGPVWVTDCLVRTLFVRGAHLNLLEICEPDSTPREVYLNVIEPVAVDLENYLVFTGAGQYNIQLFDSPTTDQAAQREFSEFLQSIRIA